MAYILTSDITDDVVKHFASVFDTYHTLADNKLKDVGMSLGVDYTLFKLDNSGCIESWYVKQFLVSWFCMRICLDKMGMNNVSISEMEKYAVKYNFYLKEADKMEAQINKQMLTGVTNNSGGSQYRTGNNILFRS